VEPEDYGYLKDALTQFRMQEVLARMCLNEEKFEEIQRMNDARLADIGEDNDRARDSLAQSFGTWAAGQDATQGRWQADFEARERDREARDADRDANRKPTYEGLSTVRATADKIIGGRPLVGDVMATAEDIQNTYDNLEAIENLAFDGGDEKTIQLIQPRKEKLEKLLKMRNSLQGSFSATGVVE